MNWPPETRDRALTACRSGKTNAVARALGVPKGTVAWWIHQDRAERGALPGARRSTCHRCDGDELDGAAYAYLLGLYLGDGHIVLPKKHRVHNLSIACTDTWPGLMDAAEAAMRAVFPHNSVCRVRARGCTSVKLYSKHLPCLFPQHGPGMKHTRVIALDGWQQQIVDAHPWPLIRGLIHSDGCRVTNWTTAALADGSTKRYEYPRYIFTNKSDDVRRIFSDTLDFVGVGWRTSRRGSDPYHVSVARRASVALMDEHIGAKY
ncbi:hypothetical protein [Streptacidiphilus carbonis]|jgi:hypothetical protein|uniref:hypothetical protein n=1 Tax=Streptacidiphilus carbonis TaxID=105422 RepID=UPI0005A77DDD|nr:hypothetical protein [Streptacidiphilus carbonis]